MLSGESFTSACSLQTAMISETDRSSPVMHIVRIVAFPVLLLYEYFRFVSVQIRSEQILLFIIVLFSEFVKVHFRYSTCNSNRGVVYFEGSMCTAFMGMYP